MPEPSQHAVHVALGSNLGDRRAAIEAALDAIDALDRVRVERRSTLIETDPVGPPGQGPYLNGVARLRVGLSPRELLDALLEIERRLGRVRDPAERWGPRTIDLDILLWEDLVLHEPGLTIPHPRLHERRFVLAPLAEIDPDAIVPTLGRPVAALLTDLDAAPR